MPKSFLKNLGGSYKQEKYCEKEVELRDKSGRSWYVKMVISRDDNSRPHFGNGWKSFCKDHDLHVGDFLVFRHQSHFIFDVFIFAPTACEREFRISKPSSEIKAKNPSIAKKVIKVEGDDEIKTREKNNMEGNSTFKSSSYPYFRTVVKYSPTSHEMPLPSEFAQKNGLSKRWCDMVLIDEKGCSWNMTLRYYRTRINGHPYIGRWRAFHKANGLNTGDAVVFELIDSGEKPVMKFYKI